MKSDIKLGALIAGGVAQRDAVHIAIAPVTSDERMYPGAHVSLVTGTTDKVQSLRGTGREIAIGVVDPFLTEPVERGVPFWLCLYPQTVTNLRHEWTHPAFGANDAFIEKSRQWLYDKARRLGVGYEDLLIVAKNSKDYNGCFGDEIDEREIEPELWEHLKVVTGIDVPVEHRPSNFRCAC